MGIGRHNDGVEAGEYAYGQDSLSLRETSGIARGLVRSSNRGSCSRG